MPVDIPVHDPDKNRFSDILAYIQKIREMKQKQPLFDAQTQEAIANARDKNFFNNLLDGGSDESSSPSSNQSQRNTIPSIGGQSNGSGQRIGSSNVGYTGVNNSPDNDSGYSYDKNGNNIVSSPETIADIANNGNAKYNQMPGMQPAI